MTQATCLALVTVLNPQEDDADQDLLTLLRRLQAACVTEAGADLTTPDADHRTAILAALNQCDPTPEDGRQDYPTLLHRVQVVVDQELSRWTSAAVQPLGPSGEIAVAAG